MRIAVVSPFLPFEEVPHAGGQFLLRHLESLVRVHDLQLYVPGVPDVQRALGEAPEWLPLVVAPFDEGRRSGIRDLIHAGRRRIRFRALPTAAARGFRQIGLAEQLAAEADLVELQWIDTTVLIRDLRAARPDLPIVVVAHDVTALTRPAYRQLTAPGRRSALRTLLDRIRTRVEAADLNAADLVLVFTEEDTVALQRLGVRTPTHVVEPSLQLPTRPIPLRTRPVVLFTGAMWRPENQHGVEWFLRGVWPPVAAAVPDVELRIVGDSPPDRIVALARAAARTVVTGRVDDMGPHYEAATAFVAPLFVPGGLKFKVPQAMVYDLPVVTTPIAAHGVRASRDLFWSITDDADEMARSIVDLLEHPESAAELGRRAGAQIRASYSFEESARAIVDRYEQLVRRAIDDPPASPSS